MRAARRHLVLDAGAAGSLTATRPGDRRRAEVLAAIAAADGAVVVPTSVRVEVGWDRRAPRWAGANRLVRRDDALDRPAADAAARLGAVGGRGVADAHVVVAALRVGATPRVGAPLRVEATVGRDVVEVLTSDPDDVEALLGEAADLEDRAVPGASVVEVRRV